MSSLYENEVDKRNHTPKAPIIAFSIAIIALGILLFRFLTNFDSKDYTGNLFHDVGGAVNAPDEELEERLNSEFDNIVAPDEEK
jgi:hypothetical protein